MTLVGEVKIKTLVGELEQKPSRRMKYKSHTSRRHMTYGMCTKLTIIRSFMEASRLRSRPKSLTHARASSTSRTCNHAQTFSLACSYRLSSLRKWQKMAACMLASQLSSCFVFDKSTEGVSLAEVWKHKHAGANVEQMTICSIVICSTISRNIPRNFAHRHLWAFLLEALNFYYRENCKARKNVYLAKNACESKRAIRG